MPGGLGRVYRSTVILIVTVLFHGLFVRALAQSSKGAISGQVTDSSGAVLKGANISIQPTNLNVASDVDGQFLLNGLSSGSYTVTVSYVGFAPFTKTIDVMPGQTSNIDAHLELETADLTVIVTAPRATAEAAALNEERSADNIEQVLPEEVIRSLPNANMADALGRLPSVTLERDEGEGKYVQIRGTEPRLNNTTIDGVNLPSPEPGVREIKFDAIPADIVESVDISKTLQANMDGDGIGGSINLVTKTATDRPIISFSSLGGYTPIIHGRGLTEETGTIGKRFGPEKRFGALIGGSYDWNGRGIDDIEPVPDIATMPNGSEVSWKDGMDVREYRYFRSRWGLAGSTDYRVGQGSDIYLRGLYSDFHNYGDRWAYTLTDNTPGITLLNPSNVGCPTNSSGATVAPCTGAPTFNAQLRNPDIGVSSLLLGGTHVLNTTQYTWLVSASRSWYGNSPYSTAVFSSTLPSSTCQYDPVNTSNQYLPRWTSECYTEGYNPSHLALNNINRGLGHSAQLNLQAGGSAAKRYHIGSRAATFEIGGKFRNAHKFADTYVLTLTPNGTIPLSTFPNRLTNSNYYSGNYNLGYNVDYEDVMAYANRNRGQFTSSSTQGQDPSQFDLIEKVSAGYVMNTIDLTARLRFIAGLRVEGTTDSVQNLAFGSDGSIAPNAFSGSYNTILPSASLKYAVGANSYLRFVYARGLSRPDPQDIAQPLSWTTAANGGNRNSVSFGNANLKAETGDDIDVLFDHYLSSFGVVSVGYFYKRLENPIITTQFDLNNYQPVGGPLGNYLATQPINGGSAWINGLEAQYLHHFTFLPGAWSGLGIAANYGYTDSRISGIPGRSDHPHLLRTSPNAFNISPTYDKRRVSIRVGMSYNQASIYGYQYSDSTPGGVKGPLSDIYFYSHFQVDAQGSIRLQHGLTLVMSALDLNNEVFGFYQGSPQYMIQREYYKPTISGGIRWNLQQPE